MTDGDWQVGYARSLAVFLNGDAIAEPDGRGERVTDDSFLLLFNGTTTTWTSPCPSAAYGERWEVVLDTAAPTASSTGRRPRPARPCRWTSRSILVLRRVV